MKKLIAKFIIAFLVGSTSVSQAAGLGGLLDGMFANVTAPDTLNSQFRGGIVGGGVYARLPIGAIQPLAIDPPRFSAGCGGIDLYLGSFSFITADKLTAFIRQVAQNAAPLAFKMAIEAAFPQLAGVLDKFQAIAQQMNDLNKNSCQMAHGLLDAVKDPQGAWDGLTNAVDNQVSQVKGWFSDTSAATEDTVANPSGTTAKVASQKNADGTQIDGLGNLVWNTLKSKTSYNWAINLSESEIESKQLVMALVGTRIVKPGASSTDQNTTLDFPPITHLSQVFNPPVNANGANFVPVYVCDGASLSDMGDCLNPSPGSLNWTGVKGYVTKQMYGDENATTAQSGSIVDLLKNCNAADCSLSSAQKNFLKQFGRVPVVGLLRKAQTSSQAVDFVANATLDVLVDEVSFTYGREVLRVTETAFGGSKVSRPESYGTTIQGMRDDLRDVDSRIKASVQKLNDLGIYIDAINRTNPGVLGYKPR